ncbi:pyrroloquinoline quinone biosynthesis protein PqqB [Roseibium litorale]|uniref:Coenzyme PQQ synthesis protein B n=1 Tax=Roseibium litorale TaxID=2803841 RepID=A0ABR9CME8_9HYPH|nr:pyrroloquinoline quinone biosynthesis protein PqqB [Roseibium litorale]
MDIRILGSAAGGGFPQWNCNATYSRAVRTGSPGFLTRTQSSLAASANGKDWVLFNASPDIREQIAATPELQPRPDGPLRDSPIRAVVLTNADVDHIAGLLSLRERQRFTLYATARVLKTLAENSIFQVLNPELVPRRELPLGGITHLEGPDGPLGLSIETFAVPGKVALFLEDASKDGFGTSEGDTVGLRITQSDGQSANLFYIPGCAAIDATLRARLTANGTLLFDGTVFTDTEMPDACVGEKTGARMGHLAISGETGTLAQLQDLPLKRKIFVHINNTNPILDPSSAASKAVRDAGWEVGYDGMELTL